MSGVWLVKLDLHGHCIGFSDCLAYVVDVDLSALRARSCNVCLAHSCVALTSTEVEELNASLDAFMFVLGKKGLPSI